ncbi:MAG: zinc ribbon domain-containing protein [Ruminococcaceae bacterium]|nr:zinc ribbon domain-containing protein [Oscillospiraceae bacterium]
MYCPKCGVKLTENAAFCHACGAKLPKEITDAENTYKNEDYDSLFTPVEDEQKPDEAPDFFSFALSDNDISKDDGLNFAIPDDWDSISEAKFPLFEDDSEYSEDDLNFIIPKNWDK